MQITLTHNDTEYNVDLSDPLDISIPLIPGSDAPNCFWAPHFEAEPVKSGDWIGDTKQGGGVNFKNVKINPHGNGTHTECVGHIATEDITINQTLDRFHHIAQVVSIYPQVQDNGDRVITKDQIIDLIKPNIKALVIRTMPNDDGKMKRKYSGTNPPYLDHLAITHIVQSGVEHLLIDLPSVDREEDGGKLQAHKAFWNYPATIDTTKTITEMIYVNNSVSDGLYLLNIQIASFELDASPSKPVLYKLNDK